MAPACTTVFVVSDDSAIRESLSELAASAGLHAETFRDLEKWAEVVEPERRGALVLDARARDLTDPQRLAQFASICARRPVVLLIDRGDVPVAVRAIKDGAVDVVEKPCRDWTVLESIRRALAAEQGPCPAR